MADAASLPYDKNHPGRIFLVSVPRTASNLLVRVLNIYRQPHVLTNDKAGYFFQDAYMRAASKHPPANGHWTDADRADIHEGYQQCLDKLETASEQARHDNKIMFTKEHAFWFVHPAKMLDAEQQQPQDDSFRLRFPNADVYGQTQTFSRHNKTLFPDEYLRTWQFVLLIRHPALAWPSMYRAMQKMATLAILDDDGMRGAMVSNMTFRWTRSLFDWCAEQQQRQGSVVPAPLILDAHDVIHHPDIVLRLCEQTGLDKDAVRSEWENDANPGLGLQPGSQSQVSDRDREAIEIMTVTLRASKGIIKEKAPATVDIDVEAEKWKKEFGPEAAAMVEKAVRDAMPDYEYLKERRLKA